LPPTCPNNPRPRPRLRIGFLVGRVIVVLVHRKSCRGIDVRRPHYVSTALPVVEIVTRAPDGSSDNKGNHFGCRARNVHYVPATNPFPIGATWRTPLLEIGLRTCPLGSRPRAIHRDTPLVRLRPITDAVVRRVGDRFRISRHQGPAKLGRGTRPPPRPVYSRHAQV